MVTDQNGSQSGAKEVYPKMDKWISEGSNERFRIQPNTVTHRINMVFLEDYTAVQLLREDGHQHAHYIERREEIEQDKDTIETLKGSDDFRAVFVPGGQVGSKKCILQYSSMPLWALHARP
jgi:hypothetical protein